MEIFKVGDPIMLELNGKKEEEYTVEIHLRNNVYVVSKKRDPEPKPLYRWKYRGKGEMRPKMTLKDQVFEEIAECINEREKEVVDETNLQEDLKYDELDIIELLLRLEDVFNIYIPDTDKEKWITAKDVFEYIEAKITSHG